MSCSNLSILESSFCVFFEVEMAILSFLQSIHSEEWYKGRIGLDAYELLHSHVHDDLFENYTQHLRTILLGGAGPFLPQHLQGHARFLDSGWFGRFQQADFFMQLPFSPPVFCGGHVFFHEKELELSQLAFEVSPLAFYVLALFLVFGKLLQSLAPILGQDQSRDQFGDLGVYLF
jgi:hypothetical protein